MTEIEDTDPYTMVFGCFNTEKTAFITAYLMNLVPDVVDASLPYTKLGEKENQKATPELINYPNIDIKKGILIVDANVVKHRMKANTDTINKYACIYRFDSNIVEYNVMDEMLKELMSKIIEISVKSANSKDLVKKFIIEMTPAIISDIEIISNDFTMILSNLC
jgi:hypothetical protein|tara:strand:- start:121 stop:612 length:492 start_codon:yes stop_codon:yes gene_type:complete